MDREGALHRGGHRTDLSTTSTAFNSLKNLNESGCSEDLHWETPVFTAVTTPFGLMVVTRCNTTTYRGVSEVSVTFLAP